MHQRFMCGTDVRMAAIVFAVSLALQLTFLLSSPDRAWPHSMWYEGDAVTWAEWAQHLDEGRVFEFDLPLRSPAVAYLLHWVAPIKSDTSYATLKALWCIAVSAANAMIYMACVAMFTRRVALIATTLCILSFGTHIMATSLNGEALYMMTLAAIILLTLGAMRHDSILLWSLSGLLHGVAMLVRPEHLLLVLLISLYGCWLTVQRSTPDVPATSPRNRWIRGPVIAAAVIVTSIVVCLPWMVRGAAAVERYNTVLSHPIAFDSSPLPWTPEARDFLASLPAFTQHGSFGAATFFTQSKGKSEVTRADVELFFTEVYGYIPEPLPRWSLVSLKGPLDFALANHPNADGGFTKAALASTGETNPTLHIGRPDHLRLIKHGYAIGWEWMRSDLGRWSTIAGEKLARFFDGVTLGFTSFNLPLGWYGERRAVDLFTATPGQSMTARTVAIAWKILIGGLVAWGIVLACTTRHGSLWVIIILYKLIVTILFYGYARQAVSIYPAFAVMVALCIDQFLTPIFNRWQPKRAIVAIALGILSVVLVLVDVVGSVRERHLNIIGRVEPAPRFGPGAFISSQPLRIEHAPAPPQP